MANWQHCPAVERHAQRNGGLWVFKGTDVPLYRLYESLASGMTVGDFAERFGVGIERVVEALRYEANELHDYRLNYPHGVSRMRNPEGRQTGRDDAIWKTCPLVEQNPGIFGGVWIFRRSRFPLYTVHDNLASGTTLDEFDEWYAIDIAKVKAILEYESATLREVPVVYADTV